MKKKFRNLGILYDYGELDTWYIEEFQRQVGICLPSLYKELMLKHNGAYLDQSYFNFLSKDGDEDMRCFLFLAFREKEDVGEHMGYTQYVADPIYYGVQGLVAFASTAEGDTICFDYRNNPKTCEPNTILLIHDEYEKDSSGTEHMKIEFIANNFDAFLDMLYENDE